MLNLKLFQKNDEMLKKFEFQQNMKKKYLLFTLLYYNKKLCQFQNKRNYKLKGNILYILKNYRIFKLTRKITDKDQMSKINKFIKIRCYRKIKNLFVIIRETQGKKNHIAEYFKTFIRKMKVFKLMKKNYLKENRKRSKPSLYLLVEQTLPKLARLRFLLFFPSTIIFPTYFWKICLKQDLNSGPSGASLLEFGNSALSHSATMAGLECH